MSILIVSPGKNLTRWTEAIEACDPSVKVLKPDEVKDKTSIRFALAWNHPHGMFADYPNLSCISSFGAGVDHMLGDPHIPGHVQMVRIIDPRLSSDMAQFALAVIMKKLRRLSDFVRWQQEGRWNKKSYERIEEVRIGIMGVGVIGNHVAEYLQKIGFRTSGWARTPRSNASYPVFSGQEQLPSFLSATDILLCILPLTPNTKGILNIKTLSMLPQGAYVVNLGRGAHVVDHDLMDSIDSGHLSGAHLDVFEEEPLPVDHPFWRHPGIDITPHVASLTDPESVAPQIVDNYHRMKSGKTLCNTISRKQGY